MTLAQLTRLCAFSLATLVGGCTVDVPVRIEGDVDLAAGDVVTVVAGEGICPPRMQLLALEDAPYDPDEPLDLPENADHVAVWVVGSDCLVKAFGCAPLEGTSAVTVTAASIPPYDRCPREVCVAGRCEEPAGICAAADLVDPSADPDGDAIPNENECLVSGGGAVCETIVDDGGNDCLAASCCDSQDSDGDDVPDYLDPDSGGVVADADADGDGLPNGLECNDCVGAVCDLAAGACSLDSDGDGHADYRDPDSDQDGVPDSEECAGFAVPGDCFTADADGDGFPPHLDVDADGDGARDGDETVDARSVAESIVCPGFEGSSWEEAANCGQCGPCVGTCSTMLQCAFPATPFALDVTANCSGATELMLSSPEGALYEGATLRSFPAGTFAGDVVQVELTAEDYPSVGDLPRGGATCRVGLCVWVLNVALATAWPSGPEPVGTGTADLLPGGQLLFASSLPSDQEELDRLGLLDDFPPGLVDLFFRSTEGIDRGFVAVGAVTGGARVVQDAGTLCD